MMFDDCLMIVCVFVVELLDDCCECCWLLWMIDVWCMIVVWLLFEVSLGTDCCLWWLFGLIWWFVVMFDDVVMDVWWFDMDMMRIIDEWMVGCVIVVMIVVVWCKWLLFDVWWLFDDLSMFEWGVCCIIDVVLVYEWLLGWYDGLWWLDDGWLLCWMVGLCLMLDEWLDDCCWLVDDCYLIVSGLYVLFLVFDDVDVVLMWCKWFEVWNG